MDEEVRYLIGGLCLVLLIAVIGALTSTGTLLVIAALMAVGVLGRAAFKLLG